VVHHSKFDPLMTASGHERPSQSRRGGAHVRLTPDSDRIGASQRSVAKCQLRKKCVAAKCDVYSITLSARSKKDSGIVSPIAFADLRLITSSNLVGCSTGSSAGLAPLKILSKKTAARSSRISTRSSKASDESGRDRICGIYENNWNCFCHRQCSGHIGGIDSHDRVGV
jgi:hypothetical protein